MASHYGDPYGDNSYYPNDPNRGYQYPSASADYNNRSYPHQTYDNMGPSYEAYPSQANQYSENLSGNDKVTFAPQQYPEGSSPPPARQRSTKKSLKKGSPPSVLISPVRKVWNGFEHGEFTPTTPKAKRKTVSAMKEYRYENQGNLWTKGGRGRCIGRFFCCTIMIVVLLLVSIVLSLALWIRPPNVDIGDVITRNTTGSLGGADGLTINLSVNISVVNPNYFNVDFRKIKAEIFYPINNVPMGGGESKNVNFPSHSQTNWTFPFALQYKSSNDPGNRVFVDLANKCGFNGGQRSDITVDYKITLGIRILLITISPVISNKFSFACPSGLTAGGLIPGTTS